MKAISIFNQVLGPVMRGPSSSHTAGAYHIGAMARSLLGGVPCRAVLTFDPEGSYAVTYAAQGADRGFAMGLMDRPLTDESFFTALEDARRAGLEIEFRLDRIVGADHPNTVAIELAAADGSRVRLVARSIGGGEVEITHIDDRPVLFNGSAYEILVELGAERADAARALLSGDGRCLQEPAVSPAGNVVRLTARRSAALPNGFGEELLALDGHARIWQCAPVYFVAEGETVFSSAAQIVELAEERNVSLGRLALDYEAQLLGMSRAAVMAEAVRRYEIMVRSVERGLEPGFRGLQLLPACASAVFEAEAQGRLCLRSAHTRAAARALAVMHVDGAMGVVCAAPTGGSAGVIPAVLVTLAEERSLARKRIGRALLAAGAIGTILARRATFAAEVAGCQVEIGAAGAMAAAAAVDAAGGTASQACDAAAISLQNTMGLVCDLLHGIVEIPCHTRNAAAASGALVCADLALGGYANLVPLDETIDAVYAVGRAMPPELRCTSKGGLADTPSARALKPTRPDSQGQQ